MSHESRTLEYPADEQFRTRWSPRAFTEESIEKHDLFTILEAARWAPSSFNAQPWHFVYALHGEDGWNDVLNALRSNNQGWAGRAAALITILSKNIVVRPGETEPVPSPTHSFDAGCAWGYLALQAHKMGWSTHAMAGFDERVLREALQVPAEYTINAVVAIGRRGDPGLLPEPLRARESASLRRPIEQSVSAGHFVPKQ